MELLTKRKLPEVSVCIPVFNAERTLLRALASVAAQSFTEWEIIVVNDGSSGTDETGRDCYKIVKQFRKNHKIPRARIIYREHKTNIGLLEARRTAIEAAVSPYIIILDSDDELLPDSLKVLYETAISTGADIVHGGAEVVATENSSDAIIKKRVSQMQKNANTIYEGVLTEQAVFDGFLVQKNHTGFLWAKLIRRETYLEALSHIPFTNCVFAEDFLQYFFISYEAKKYAGIKKTVYRYYVDVGISSFQKISNLDRWRKICSTANVFTILFQAVKELPLERYSQIQKEALQLQSCSYLANNIKQLKESVIPELQPQAREILCEYWGESFVNRIEEALQKSK